MDFSLYEKKFAQSKFRLVTSIENSATHDAQVYFEKNQEYRIDVKIYQYKVTMIYDA